LSKNKYFLLILIILSTFLITIPAGLITRTSVDTWYAALNKPALNPPNWIFGYVWSFLYVMMSIAAWDAFVKSEFKRKILAIYYFHIFVNASWSYVFFYYKQIFAASLIIGLIIFFILYLISMYSKYSKLSVLLMLPYFAWCIFAMYLNSTIWIIN